MCFGKSLNVVLDSKSLSILSANYEIQRLKRLLATQNIHTTIKYPLCVSVCVTHICVRKSQQATAA